MYFIRLVVAVRSEEFVHLKNVITIVKESKYMFKCKRLMQFNIPLRGQCDEALVHCYARKVGMSAL